MVSAEQFIAVLQQKDLLPSEVMENLRQQVRESKKPLSASALAHRLIRQKLLTPVVAERLLAAAGLEKGESDLVPPQFEQRVQDPGPASTTAEQGRPTEETSGESMDDDLELAPLDDEPPYKAKSRRGAPAAAPQPSALDAEQPVRDARGQQGPPPPPGKGQPPARSLLEEELAPLDGTGKAPLDALMADAAMDDPLGSGPRAKRGLRRWLRDLFRRKKRSKSDVVYVKPVDTRQAILLIASWGGAILLLVLVIGLFWIFSPPSPQKLLAQADSDYADRDYSQAIQRYEEYLQQFPKYEGASRARVRLGLSRLQVAVREAKQGADWLGAFDVAQQFVRALQSETRYQDEKDLTDAGLAITAIAEGLASQTLQQSDEALLNKARAAVSLVDNTIPESLRPTARLDDVRNVLKSGARLVEREGELDRVLRLIRDSSAKEPMGAYAARNALVKQYPELADNDRLEEALRGPAKTLQSAVKMVEERRAAETAERASGILSTVLLARQTVKSEVLAARGNLVFASAGGAVYALNGANGQIRWRRFVSARSEAANNAILPLPVPGSVGNDVILSDPVHNELVRVEGPGGNLHWRHTLAKPLAAPPVQVVNRLLAPTEENRLAIVDLLGGESPGHVQMPQPCRVSPTFDSDRSRIYQVADQSNLYVLSQNPVNCLQVFHLGHEPDSIVVPPVMAGDLLIVAVNENPKESTLRVLALPPPGQEQGGVLVRLIQQMRLKGTIKTAPLVSGQRMLVVTSQRDIHFLNVNPEEKRPLKLLAQIEAPGETEAVRFPLLWRDQFWVADTELAGYAMRGRIVQGTTTDQGSAFLQSLSAFGQTLYCVRRKPGSLGVTVSALSMSNHEAQWQTLLAAPLAGEPLVDAARGEITAVTSAGGMYPLKAAEIQGRKLVPEPFQAAEASQAIRDLVPIGGSIFAITTGPGTSEIFIYDPEQKRFRFLKAPNRMACSPVLMAGGLLTPGDNGNLSLLDPKTAADLAAPCRATPNSTTAWNSCSAAAVGTKEAVLCDRQRRLYRIAIQDTPPRLIADEAVANQPIVSPVAVAGNVAYVVDKQGTAATFELPSLAPRKEHRLEGLCAWGPQSVGKVVLVATDKGRLYAFNERQEMVWQTTFAYGPLAGTPAAATDSYYLASKSGTVWKVDATSGKEQGKVEAGVPLGTGPVLLGDRLFVAGHDGTLYEVKRP